MSRQLPIRPNLEHLRKQARDLLGELRRLKPDVRLADAQRVLARQYGFGGWAELRTFVEHPGPEVANRRAVAGFAKDLARRSLARLESEHGGAVFSRYTEAAREAIFLARFEAYRRGGATIHSEHLLLALMGQGGSVGQLFERAGVSVERTRERLETRIAPESDSEASPRLSPECRRALDSAVAEADAMRHADIDALHLLLGLIAASQSVAGSVLIDAGMTLEQARRETLAILSR